MSDFVIRKSIISGRGVFAGRNFLKGEVVLMWSPKRIKKADIDKLPKRELAFIEKLGSRYYLMQSPERYVNHSCSPNTETAHKSDIAIRNIKKGEEITSDYSGQGLETFKCNCGSAKCKNFIK